MNEDTEPKLYSIIKAYETLVKGIDKVAHDSLDRAYGGIVRAGKGKLVESIGKELVKIAWVELGEDMKRLSFVNKTIKIPLKKDYLNRIKDSEVRNYIEKIYKECIIE